MTTVEATVSAQIRDDALERLGSAMEAFAQPFDGDAAPKSFMPLNSPDVERQHFGDRGVSVTLESYDLDGISVRGGRRQPLADDTLADLIPAGASGWHLAFHAWRNFPPGDGLTWNHAYLKIQQRPNTPTRLSLNVFAPSEQRAVDIIEAARLILSEYPPPVPVPIPNRPFKVFIAFGGGNAWEVVRDYLKRADIAVDAFTEAERAGQITLDVVAEMIGSATMAVIVMTAADEMRDGTKRARQNVIHEAGYSHGALGVRNTIVLLEEGVDAPSNIAGVTYIPFKAAEIHRTENRVVALIQDRMRGI